MKYFTTLLLLLALPWAADAQNVGIGTSSPTQTLDVNGALRVRGLSGVEGQLPQVQADGTLGLLAPPLASAATDPYAARPVLLNPNPAGGTTGGTATQSLPASVAVSGNIAYVANSSYRTLQLFDVSNPASPVLLGTASVGSVPAAIDVSNQRAYVVNFSSNTLQIFDVRNPAQPVLLNPSPAGGTSGGTPTGQSPRSIVVRGDLAYVVNINGYTLQIFDVRTPARPVLLNARPAGGTSGGFFPGRGPADLAVSGTLAYVVASSDNLLQVVDVSDPANPVLRGSVQTDTQPTNVAVSGSLAYVGNKGGNSLQIFDISNPDGPVLRGTLPTGAGAPVDVAANGSTVYMLSGTTLQVVDASDPARPVLRGAAATDASPMQLAVSGSTAYVISNSNSTLQAFQVAGVRSLGLLADGTLGVSAPLTLRVSGQQLGLSGSNTVTLPGDNLGNHTATRQLALAATGLKFSDGTSLTTTPVGDNLGNHTATRNLNLADYQLVGQGGPAGLSLSSAGYLGVGTPRVPVQLLELGGRAAPTLLLHANANSQVNGPALQWRESSLRYGWNLRHNTGASEGGSTNDRLLLERVNDGITNPTMSWDQNTGQVGIGTSTPAATLDVRGSVSVSEALSTPALRTPATGTHNMMPIAYGSFFLGKLVLSSGNVAVNIGQTDNGYYSIELPDVPASTPFILVLTPIGKPFGTDYRAIEQYPLNPAKVGLGALVITSKNGQPAPGEFSFTIYTY